MTFVKSGNFLAIFANFGTILAILLPKFNQILLRKFFEKNILKKDAKVEILSHKNAIKMVT